MMVRSRALPTLLLAMLLPACTTLTKELAEPAPAGPHVIAVGSIEAGGAEWERVALRFQRSLVAHLQVSGVFAEVRSSVARALPSNALVVNGTVLDADPGSDLIQLAIGLGFGSPSAEVELRITDAEDRLLLVFSESVLVPSRRLDVLSSEPIEVHDLMDDIANDAAEEIVRWSQGKPVRETLF
jgi:hypothetical protein